MVRRLTDWLGQRLKLLASLAEGGKRRNAAVRLALVTWRARAHLARC